MKSTLLRIGAIYLCIVVFGSAQRYTITPLPPMDGDSFADAHALNAAGQAAGRSGARAVIWTDGIPRDIQTLLEGSSVAFGLNARGQAVGDISTSGTRSGAFYWNGITMQRLLHPLGFVSEAYALNDSGVVVGTGLTTGGFRWNGGSFSELSPLAGDHSATPSAINNEGAIVGTSWSFVSSRPVIWTSPNSPTRISVPFGAQGTAWGLNDDGLVVGEYYSDGEKPFSWTAAEGAQALPFPDGATSGYAWAVNSEGTIVGETDLGATVWRKDPAGSYAAFLVETLIPSDSGWSNLSISAINSAGQIAGSGIHNYSQLGFILTPAPGLELALRVDRDRSGTTEFKNDADKTSPTQPFYFWLNDDRDALGYEASRGPIDSSDLRIMTPILNQGIELPRNDAIRDLEDFARLTLKLTSEMKTALDEGAALVLEARGIAAINLFYTRSTTNETRYLTDEGFAISLINNVATNIALQSESPAIGVKTWQTVESAITDEDWNCGRLSFLWEAVTGGPCVIVAQLRHPNGTVIESEPVHLLLHPVREFFERVRATPVNGFPPPWDSEGQAPAMSWEVVHPQLVDAADQQDVDLVWVHGWRLPEWERQNWGEIMFKRLWHAGFNGRFHSFTWPTYSDDDPLRQVGPEGLLSYNRSEYRAWKSGAALQTFLSSIRTTNPHSQLAVIAHSMGNIVASEALRLGGPAEIYLMMQAAVPAGCYDPHQNLIEPELLAEDSKQPTPDWSSELGYRGRFASIDVPIVNLYNSVDYALQSGKILGLRANWIKNQLIKPEDPLGKGAYAYPNASPGIYSGKRLIRRLHDIHESMSFLARSRTRAVGAQPLTGFDEAGVLRSSPIVARVDLQHLYGFTGDDSDHSAQFNRAIQKRVVDFFSDICVHFQP